MLYQNKNRISCFNVIAGGLVSLTIVSGIVLSSSTVFAHVGTGEETSPTDSAIDNVDITVSISCNLTSVLDSAHSASIENGRNVANIGTTTLKVFCNDASGFAIYAAGYTNDEIGETNSNKLIGLNGQISVGNISTGVATSGATSNWSMKLIKVTNTSGQDAITYNPENLTILSDSEGSFANYHTVPNEYTKVATFSSATDITLGSVLQTTYQTYISSTQPAGTYTGKVIYALVHPSIAPTPSTNCSSGQLIMQNVSEWGSSVTSGNEVTACDARDGKTYTVARLADGNLWMTQNLDHDIVTNGSVTYDNTTTDLPANTTWIPERATYATGTTTWGLYDSTTGDHEGFYRPESYDPGDYYWNSNLSDWSDWNDYYNSCTYNDDTWLYENCDESLNPTDTYISSTGNSHYHLGNYYNWNAAVAMNDSSSYTTDGTIINQSICPAGWTLPIGGYYESPEVAPNKSFQNLIEQYGWDDNDWTMENPNIWNTAIKLPLGGDWYGMLEDVGGGGDYWSSVVGGSGYAYNLDAVSDGDVSPNGGGDRGYGGSVRCVAR